MNYDIEVMPEAERDLEKFDPELQRRFFKKTCSSRDIVTHCVSCFP